MKNNYFKWGFLVAMGLATFVSKAQDHKLCGTDEHTKALIQADPSILQRQIESDKRLQKLIENYAQKGAQAIDLDRVVTIPIVFHVIHQYGPENISDDQLLSAVRILNEDFMKENADTATVIAPFKNKIGKANIKFELATIDPFGNCTNGINRIASLETDLVRNGLYRARFGVWNPSKYLNIWVTRLLPDGAAGISTFPSSAVGPGSTFDGISMLSNYTGDRGTSGPGGARALTHEVGHFLNLYHIWGNTEPATVCGDDEVEDTPITKGFNPNSIPCQSMPSVCDTNHVIVENHQNYMDYAYCQQMYTPGQVFRMRAVLFPQNASDSAAVAFRYNLFADANLAATGINGVTNKVCAPEADFYPDKLTVCRNTAVVFTDNTTKNFVTERTWSFPDGNPASSTSRAPSVRYSTPGWKTATLTVKGSGGQATKTITRVVFVSDETTAAEVPYIQSFRNNSIFGESWLIGNPESNQTSWKPTEAAGYWDPGSVMLNASEIGGGRTIVDGNGDVDILTTPSFNLAGKADYILFFNYAAATKATSSVNMKDSLVLEGSANCGGSWSTIKTFNKSLLYSGGYHEEGFTPQNKNEWKSFSTKVKGGTGASAFDFAKDNVRFRFRYVSSSYSNNIYIDDFQISSVTGIQSVLAANLNVTVYPNPITEESVVEYQVGAPTEVVLNILDVTGKVAVSKNLGVVSEGGQKEDLSTMTSTLRAGVYFLTVNAGG
ncbi:MAG: M43 family zinc metalloprotease, partial [Bacteroidota bacterium]